MKKLVPKLAYPGILATALLALGCGQPDMPKMCIMRAEDAGGQAIDPKAQSCDAVNEAQKDAPIRLVEGDVFILRHELPEKVEPPERLHVRIAAACGAPELVDVDYGLLGEQRIALLSRPAPPGSACSLVVTATIANSSLSVTTETDPDACKNVVCLDAGGEETGDAGP